MRLTRTPRTTRRSAPQTDPVAITAGQLPSRCRHRLWKVCAFAAAPAGSARAPHGDPHSAGPQPPALNNGRRRQPCAMRPMPPRMGQLLGSWQPHRSRLCATGNGSATPAWDNAELAPEAQVVADRSVFDDLAVLEP